MALPSGDGVKALTDNQGCNEAKVAKAAAVLCQAHGDAMCGILRAHGAHTCSPTKTAAHGATKSGHAKPSAAQLAKSLKHLADHLPHGIATDVLDGKAPLSKLGKSLELGESIEDSGVGQQLAVVVSNANGDTYTCETVKTEIQNICAAGANSQSTPAANNTQSAPAANANSQSAPAANNTQSAPAANNTQNNAANNTSPTQLE
jgi:hypothetical protein